MYDKLNGLDNSRKEERELNIRLNVSDEHYDEIEQRLRAAGFEIDDDAEFVITERVHSFVLLLCHIYESE